MVGHADDGEEAQQGVAVGWHGGLGARAGGLAGGAAQLAGVLLARVLLLLLLLLRLLLLRLRLLLLRLLLHAQQLLVAVHLRARLLRRHRAQVACASAGRGRQAARVSGWAG